MFQKAVQIAADFTLPIVMSRKTIGGTCSSGIGTFVVVNKQGWIVTAAHILNRWVKLTQAVEGTRLALAQREAIKANTTLTHKERAKALASGPQIGKDDSDQCSLWAAWPGVQLTQLRFYENATPEFGELIDLGVAKLEPFNPEWIKTYPVFKDPKKDFEPGRSLCKLGFPFHQFQPTWDAATGAFQLPPGALPMPRFPIEGIFTRSVNLAIEASEPPPFPITYVETSSPGLLGQSGGPTFDIHGTVWAIQAKTSHLPLGFSGQNQYFNVGLGVHPNTIFPIFKDAGIEYQVSDY